MIAGAAELAAKADRVSSWPDGHEQVKLDERLWAAEQEPKETISKLCRCQGLGLSGRVWQVGRR